MAAQHVAYRRLDPAAQERVRELLGHLPVHAETAPQLAATLTQPSRECG